MTCACQSRKDDFGKRPRTPCADCGRKHLATAAALAREFGYEYVNAQFISGELVLSAWHFCKLGDAGRELSGRLREIRHKVAGGEEVGAEVWEDLILAARDVGGKRNG